MMKFMRKALRRHSISSSPSRIPSDHEAEAEDPVDPTLPIPPSPPPSPSRPRRRHLRFPLRSTRSFSDAKDPNNNNNPSQRDASAIAPPSPSTPRTNINNNVTNHNHTNNNNLNNNTNNHHHHNHHLRQHQHQHPQASEPIPQAPIFYDMTDDNISNPNSLHRFPQDSDVDLDEQQPDSHGTSDPATVAMADALTRQSSFARDYYDARFPSHFSTMSASNLSPGTIANSARLLRPRHNSFTPDTTPVDSLETSRLTATSSTARPRALTETTSRYDPTLPPPGPSAPNQVEHQSEAAISLTPSQPQPYQQVQFASQQLNPQRNHKRRAHKTRRHQSQSFSALQQQNSNEPRHDFDAREYLASSTPSLPYNRHVGNGTDAPRITTRRSKTSIKDPSTSPRRRKQNKMQQPHLHQVHQQQQQQQQQFPSIPQSQTPTQQQLPPHPSSPPGSVSQHRSLSNTNAQSVSVVTPPSSVRTVEASPFTSPPTLHVSDPTSSVEARLYAAYTDALHDEARSRAGGLRTIVNLLRDCDGNAVVIEKAALAIACLSEKDAATRDVFGQYAAVQTLIQCLTMRIPTRCDRVATVEMVVYAIASLLKESPRNVRLFEMFDGARKMGKAAASQMYENHPAIPNHALKALCELKHHPVLATEADSMQLLESPSMSYHHHHHHHHHSHHHQLGNGKGQQRRHRSSLSSSLSSSSTSSSTASPVPSSTTSSATTRTIRYVLRCMSLHEHRVDIQEHGLDALRTLMARTERGSLSASVLRNCVLVTGTSFKMHKESREIQWQCLSLMCDIEDARDGGMFSVPLDVVSFFGALRLVVAKAKEHGVRQMRVTKALLGLIRRAVDVAVTNSWRHVEFKDIAVDAGAVETMLEALSLCEGDAHVVDKICTVLRVLFQSEEGRYRMNTVGSACAILAGIETANASAIGTSAPS